MTPTEADVQLRNPSFKQQLVALEKQVAEHGMVLTEAQVAALEEAR